MSGPLIPTLANGPRRSYGAHCALAALLSLTCVVTGCSKGGSASAVGVGADLVPVEPKTWAEAIAAIQASDGEQASSLYQGLEIAEDPSLVPIGMNPQTGFWEFVHRASGVPGKQIPRRNAATGRLVPDVDMGVVLVLLPSGQVPVGDDLPRLRRNDVVLAPFFIAKYEVTQAQWQRITGSGNPSFFKHQPNAPLLPVDGVPWDRAEKELDRVGLVLPTELQWEYGCRAGTTTRWWTGSTPESLRGKASYDAWDPQPVGLWQPNAFGLYDTAGTVYEWCRDQAGHYGHEREGDGFRIDRASRGGKRVCRSGRHGLLALAGSSGSRSSMLQVARNRHLGIRAAKAVRLPD
ncbi:MAG: formylglycine-generating enzyme family protein [Planctomycetota bacterium]|nr:formylglycine-generating enzyme family protein [Planctomycetota bacterium]